MKYRHLLRDLEKFSSRTHISKSVCTYILLFVISVFFMYKYFYFERKKLHAMFSCSYFEVSDHAVDKMFVSTEIKLGNMS